MKRRHLLLMALSLILTICMCFTLAACSSCDDDDEAPAKLSTPVVTIDNSGVASWLEVENASGYAYVIGGGTEIATTKLSVTLTDGQSVKVKAKGDGTNYSDSDFSEVKTYTAPAKQPVQLNAPEVTIGTDGTVTIGSVEHATKIVYVIGDGTETEYDASSKPVLSDGQTIKVTAKGDGTNYSDSTVVTKTYNADEPNPPQPSEVMTHAEFVAAADKANVTVQGVVSAFVKTEKYGYNIYMQDNDGGYYIYGTTGDVAQTFAKGVTIKAVGEKGIYNGLHQVKNATIEIIDATANPVEANDITELIKGDTDLKTLQSTLVTVKGAVVTDVVTDTEKNRTNVTLTVGSKTVVFYIGGSQLVTAEEQTSIVAAFNDAKGKSADVTAIAAVFNSFQLIPANATPLSNVQTKIEPLAAPTVTVDQTTGIATWGVIDGATKYVYKLNDETDEQAKDAPAEREVHLQNKGDKIYVKAIGDGETYEDSPWSVEKIWSNVDPSTLPALDAPATVTISENGLTITWAAVTGATSYKYVIGDGADTEVNGLTVTLETALTAGQTVKVKAVGDLVNHKDSEYKTATYVKKLVAPTVEIDDEGYVTITCENADKITYVIGDSEEAVYSADNKPRLTNGQKITVTAIGNKTAYADSDPVEKTYVAVMTHAEYADAANNANVSVKGVVTALNGKHVFFADSNGAYYLYGAGKNDTTVIPENLAVGMEIKVSGTKKVYNGLDKITNATVEITNSTPATVTPIEITDKIGNDAELKAMQNSLVVVKGVTVSKKDDKNYTLTCGDKTITFYVNSNVFVTSAQQTAIKAAFNDAEKYNKTVDVTAILSVFTNVQLIPVNAAPLSNIILAKLATPSVSINEETGEATVTDIDEHGKAVYSIDGAEFTAYDAETKPVVPYGKTIKVKVVDDTENYTESAEASAKYDAQQVPLADPVITIIPVSGKVTVVVNDTHATNCVYTVLDEHGAPVAEKTDVPFDKTVELTLENKQSIKVVISSSNGRYTTKEVTEQHIRTNELRIHDLKVDLEGYVTWGETGGANFTYKIKEKGQDNFGDETTTTDNKAQKVKINDGDTLYVKANKANDEQIDTNANAEITYHEPQNKYDTPELATTDAIKVNPNKQDEVIITLKTVDGVKYEVSIDGADYTAVTDGAVKIPFTAHTSIKFRSPASVPATYDGNYASLYKASDELDVTTVYGNFSKVHSEIGEIIIKDKVGSEETISLATQGTTNTDVAFSWQLDGGNKPYAELTGGNSLKLMPIAADIEGVTVKLIVTATLGTVTLTKDFTITVKLDTSAVLKNTKFTGATSSGNLAGDGANNAEDVGLNAKTFTVTSEKTGTNHVGLNKDGTIRLYRSETCTMTVTVAEGLVITSIKVTLASNSPAKLSYLKVVSDGHVISGTDGTYIIGAISFALSNTSSADQIYIEKIEINYQPPTDAMKADMDLAALTDINGNYTESSDLTLAKVTGEKSGFEITWSPAEKDNTVSNNGSGTFAIGANGKVTIVQGTDADTVFKVTATIACTCGGETDTHKHTRIFTVTVVKKLSNAEKATADLKALTDISGEYTEKSVLSLPASKGAQSNFDITWSPKKDDTVTGNGSGTFTIEADGKVTIKQGTDADTVFKVTATIDCDCGDAANHKHTRDFTVTVKVKSNEKTISIDLTTASSLQKNGSEIKTDADALKCLKSAIATDADKALLTSAAFTKIYDGNTGNTGAFKSKPDGKFLKTGSSSVNGTMKLTFGGDKKVKQVIINCHAWTTSSSDTVTINNGTAQAASKTGTATDLTFDLATSASELNITFTKRVFIFSITVVFE